MKDIELLKEEILKLRGFAVAKYDDNRGKSIIPTISLEDLFKLLDQLPEHETLSQEWIDDNVVEVTATTGDGETYLTFRESSLRDVLVPKQEEVDIQEIYQEGFRDGERGILGDKEIPEEQAMEWLDNNDFYDHRTAETVLANAVDKGELSYYGTKYSVIEKTNVPQFVADYIDWCKEEGISLGVTFHSALNGDLDEPVQSWIRKSQEELIKAWLVYPNIEVEEEQKYYVLDKNNQPLLEKSDQFDKKRISKVTDLTDWARATDRTSANAYIELLSNYQFTEQEIKDYDERYWPFRKPVEELE